MSTVCLETAPLWAALASGPEWNHAAPFAACATALSTPIFGREEEEEEEEDEDEDDEDFEDDEDEDWEDDE